MSANSSASSLWEPAEGMSPGITETFILRNPHGLHARPAGLVVGMLKEFDCTVTIECGGHSVDGRSILGLLCLAAGYESRLTFNARGREAARALGAMKDLFGTNFEGTYQGQQQTPSAELRLGCI
jgi:phosphotransferase system HPr (HPr) family protein